MSPVCGYKRFTYPDHPSWPLAGWVFRWWGDASHCTSLWVNLSGWCLELNFSRMINSNLNTSVATIVSVGKEPGPIDFPIVHHTVAFLVHFRQLFRAEKKWGMRLRNKAIKNCLPVVRGKSELAQIILNIEKFFGGDIGEAAVHFILIHSLQCQNILMVFPEEFPTCIDGWFLLQTRMSFLSRKGLQPSGPSTPYTDFGASGHYERCISNMLTSG